MNVEPIFCYPALDNREYLAHLKAVYEASRHDPTFACELTPVQTAPLAEQAVALRLSILRRVYAGEYFTDSFDLPRLAERVRCDREFIWFWGSPASIDGCLAAGETTPSARDLGTVSVIDSSEEFGPGMGEICRSGSMAAIPLKPYAVKRILDFMTGSIPAVHAAFHTLLLVPRVRASAEGIRGGRSVNTIHRKYIRSRFWGFAPWYVMQGGFLECLEYREINRNLSDVLDGIGVFSGIHLAHEDDLEFVRSLFALNFPGAVEGISFATHGGGRKPGPFRLVCQPNESFRAYNHRTFELADAIGSREPAMTLDQIDATLHDVACTVINLCISSPETIGAQQELRRRGYWLTCIRPPRLIGTRRVPCVGVWARPNLTLPLAPPHYVVRDSIDSHERQVMRHLRGLLDGFATSTSEGSPACVAG